jgi:hypothetical protein
MSQDPYVQPRRRFRRLSDDAGIFKIGAAETTQTLVTASDDDNLYHKIHVQRIRVYVLTGSAGKTWQLKSSAPDAEPITPVMDVSASGVVLPFDFGPQGYALPAGRDLVLEISAAGAAATIEIEGFQEDTHDPIVI